MYILFVVTAVATCDCPFDYPFTLDVRGFFLIPLDTTWIYVVTMLSLSSKSTLEAIYTCLAPFRGTSTGQL